MPETWLVSPEAVVYYPVPADLYTNNYVVPPELVRDLRPDYIVSLEVFIRQSLLEASWFKESYQPIWRAETTVFASRGMLIYARTAPGK